MAELKLDIVLENFNRFKKRLENVEIGSGATSQRSQRGGGGRTSGGLGKTVALLGGIFAAVGALVGGLDAITGVLQIIGRLINSLVAPFVPFLLTVLKPVTTLLGVVMGFLLKFLKNPMGSLIKLGAFIVNGIVSGLEFMTNALLGAINFLIRGINQLIPGKRFDSPLVDRVELPRFQIELIERAVQNFEKSGKKALEDGKISFEENLQRTKNFFKDVGNSFVKTSELNKVVEKGVSNGLKETAVLGAVLDRKSGTAKDILGTALDNMIRAGEEINKKASQLAGTLGFETESSRFQQTFRQPVRKNDFTDSLAQIRRDVLDNISRQERKIESNVVIQGTPDQNTIKEIEKNQRINLSRIGANL